MFHTPATPLFTTYVLFLVLQTNKQTNKQKKIWQIASAALFCWLHFTMVVVSRKIDHKRGSCAFCYPLKGATFTSEKHVH